MYDIHIYNVYILIVVASGVVIAAVGVVIIVVVGSGEVTGGVVATTRVTNLKTINNARITKYTQRIVIIYNV